MLKINKKIDSATNLSASDKNKLETNGEKNTALLSNLEEKLIKPVKQILHKV